MNVVGAGGRRPSQTVLPWARASVGSGCGPDRRDECGTSVDKPNGPRYSALRARMRVSAGTYRGGTDKEAARGDVESGIPPDNHEARSNYPTFLTGDLVKVHAHVAARTRFVGPTRSRALKTSLDEEGRCRRAI